MVTVEVNLSDNMSNLGQLPKEMIKKGLQDTSKELIRNLMINSPVNHGLLKQWAVTSENDTEIIVQSPAEYAEYVNYGTKGSPPGKVLVFDPDPKYGYLQQFVQTKGKLKGKAVLMNTNGIEGKHFVEDSIEATQSRIAEFFTINTGG